MTPRDHCQGWADELCAQAPVGILYQGYADRSWDAQLICLEHFLEVVATLDSRVTAPTHVELRAVGSLVPRWARA
jgi:hypothetical protein